MSWKQRDKDVRHPTIRFMHVTPQGEVVIRLGGDVQVQDFYLKQGDERLIKGWVFRGDRS